MMFFYTLFIAANLNLFIIPRCRNGPQAEDVDGAHHQPGAGEAALGRTAAQARVHVRRAGSLSETPGQGEVWKFFTLFQTHHHFL